MASEKLDAVITWVDGSDPDFIRLKARYAQQERGQKGVQSFGLLDTRFKNIGEVEFCIKLIRKNINFVRNIFLVTNGQVPSFLSIKFREEYGVKIITHKYIFKGFENYLPVFNSRSIEAMLVNIPNISKKFLYFNDDVFVASEMKLEEFVKGGKIIYSGAFRFKNIWLDRVHRLVNSKFHKGTVGLRSESKYFPRNFFYFTPMHTVHLIDKEVMKDAIINYGGFEKIIKYKFRNVDQAWPIGLYINELARKKKLITKPSSSVGYFHGAPNADFDFTLRNNVKIFSLQSLDTLPDQEASKALLFLKELTEK